MSAEQDDFRSGFAVLIGRPNSGKSTLMNTVLGEHLSIVTSLPQTTRRNLRGILTTDALQVVFIDTPGIHSGRHILNRAMVDETVAVLKDGGIDIIVYIVDVSREFGEEEKNVAGLVMKAEIPVLIIFNKIDLCKDRDRAISEFYNLFPSFRNAPSLKIVATDRSARDAFVGTIGPFIPRGPKLYDRDELTDASMRFFAAEYLRKQIILNTREEVPHAAFIEIESYRETPGKHQVDATIHVETIGQRGIIIGKGGTLITRIRKGAEKEMSALAGVPVAITCHIKVTPGWRDNERFLRSAGYRG